MIGQIQNVADIFQNVYASGFIGFLTAASALYLLYRGIKGRGTTRIMAVCVLLISIFIFIPPFSTVIMKLIDSYVYWRVFWLLPSAVLIAWAGTSIFDQQKGSLRKIAAAVICIAAVGLSGRFMFTSEYYEPRENIYALPQEVVTIAEVIKKDAAARGDNFLKRIIAPTGIAMYIRTYDGTITQAYGRETIRNDELKGESYFLVNGDDTDFAKLAPIVRKRKIRYVVLKVHNADKEAALANGLEEIYIDSEYVIYINQAYV